MKISMTHLWKIGVSPVLHAPQPSNLSGFLLKFWFIFLLLSTAFNLQAQNVKDGKQKYWKVSVSNSHSAKPFASFSSLFYRDFHPGFDVAYESTFRQKTARVWFYEIRTGYMFHQWVQHNIALYGNIGYRHALIKSWFGEFKLGGGYQHSIPNSKVYEITESEGLKKKNNFGRSQAIANFSIAISKRLSQASNIHLFLEYKQQIQTPFIKEYVPILPYNSMLLGVKIPIQPSIKLTK